VSLLSGVVTGTKLTEPAKKSRETRLNFVSKSVIVTMQMHSVRSTQTLWLPYRLPFHKAQVY